MSGTDCRYFVVSVFFSASMKLSHIFLMSGYDDFRSSSLRGFGAAKRNIVGIDY